MYMHYNVHEKLNKTTKLQQNLVNVNFQQKLFKKIKILN